MCLHIVFFCGCITKKKVNDPQLVLYSILHSNVDSGLAYML